MSGFRLIAASIGVVLLSGMATPGPVRANPAQTGSFTQCVKNEGGFVLRVTWYNVTDKTRKAAEQKITTGQQSCNSGVKPTQQPRFAKVVAIGAVRPNVYEGVPERIKVYGTIFNPTWAIVK